MMNSWNNGDHMAGWDWVWMAGWMLLVTIGIVALVMWIARSVQSRSTPGIERPDGETSLQVLKRRYAAGDIDDEEFEQRRKRLEA